MRSYFVMLKCCIDAFFTRRIVSWSALWSPKIFVNGSPKRRTVSPTGLWSRRVLFISVAVGALIVLVLSGCPDESKGAYTCANGTPVTGTPGGSSNEVRCQSCADGYTLSRRS